MNYLEQLVQQYYEWKGCVVKANIKVGRLRHGGYAVELDVVIFDPKRNRIIHYEPSTDAAGWKERIPKYRRKFALGRKYIHKVVFPWLPKRLPIEQIAVFFNADGRKFLSGKAISIDMLVKKIRVEIEEVGPLGANAIPESYNILRTIQLVACGYRKPL